MLTTKKHWCAIFNAIAFVIIFFCMEETNYNRVLTTPSHGPMDPEHEDPSDGEKGIKGQATHNTEVRTGTIASSNRTYLDKLKLFRSEHFQDVPWKGMLTRPFQYFSLPIVVFCGFMYGAVICYFGVLNGTASVILSGAPYNFSPRMVGLCYVSCVIGVFIG